MCLHIVRIKLCCCWYMAAGPIYLYTFEPLSMGDLCYHTLDLVPAGQYHRQSTAQHSLFPLLISMTEYRQSAWAIGNNWRGTEYDVNYDSSPLTPPKHLKEDIFLSSLSRDRQVTSLLAPMTQRGSSATVFLCLWADKGIVPSKHGNKKHIFDLLEKYKRLHTSTACYISHVSDPWDYRLLRTESGSIIEVRTPSLRL